MYIDFNQLILKYRDGDKESAKILLDAVKPIILKNVHLLCRNKSDWMDMVQEGFLIALESTKTYRIGSCVTYPAYLNCALRYGIRNKFIKREHVILNDKIADGVEIIDLIADSSQDIYELFDKKSEFQSLKKAILKLNQRQKMIIIERYFKSRMLKDIAKDLGTNYYALLKEHQRILKKLKKYLTACPF